MKTVELQVIEKPVCPACAGQRTRARFAAWAEWDGYGRRPGYPKAAILKDRTTKKNLPVKRIEHLGWTECVYEA